MAIPRWKFCRVTAETLLEGTTVRYHWRDGSGLATVTEKTDRRVAFRGPDCDGRFTHDQIDRLVRDGRLQVVLDDERHGRA
jgi:hypothetical protein